MFCKHCNKKFKDIENVYIATGAFHRCKDCKRNYVNFMGICPVNNLHEVEETDRPDRCPICKEICVTKNE